MGHMSHPLLGACVQREQLAPKHPAFPEGCISFIILGACIPMPPKPLLSGIGVPNFYRFPRGPFSKRHKLIRRCSSNRSSGDLGHEPLKKGICLGDQVVMGAVKGPKNFKNPESKEPGQFLYAHSDYGLAKKPNSSMRRSIICHAHTAPIVHRTGTRSVPDESVLNSAPGLRTASRRVVASSLWSRRASCTSALA